MRAEARLDARLPWPRALLAFAAAAVWGSNFVVIKIGLEALPPLFFAALRFALAFFPAVLFVPRPKAPLARLAGFGLFIGVGQFGLLFIAMAGKISPGLASLVIQTQVAFTLALAFLLHGERVGPARIAALIIAAAGVGLIAVHMGGSASLIGLGLTLAAALCWAAGNMIAKVSAEADTLGFVVWASLFAVPPLAALSFGLEGWSAIKEGLARADWATWAAALWQGAGPTLFGYGVWSWLLARHPAAAVAPSSLLAPVFGLAASAVFLHEALPAWKLAAAALVIVGLLLGLIEVGRPKRSSEERWRP
ncbi:MAG: EamA family transporter [Caulobacteraceae bacterium]